MRSEARRRVGSVLGGLAGSDVSFEIVVGSLNTLELGLWSTKAIAKIPHKTTATLLAMTDEELEAWLRPYVNGLRDQCGNAG
jgi:hypothetical protein